jgi:tRNA (guanosine-2'-O-)-methyltransferase
MTGKSERRCAKIRAVLERRQPDLTVVMENIHDPHNVSAVLRSCDAAGVLQVDLLYTVEKFPKIGRKSSSSANKWLARRKSTSVEECYARLRAGGFRIFATHLSDDAVPLHEIDLTRPTALVFGNEHRGVSDEAAHLADANVRIPMMGMIQSLNVSVAAAVALFEALRQRDARGMYGSPRLREDLLEQLYREWIAR